MMTDNGSCYIRPGVFDLGEAVFDAVFPAVHVEHVRHVSGCRTICVAWREGELNAMSVTTVWILLGTASISAIGNADAELLPVFLTNCTKANLIVRSVAT